MRAAAEFPRRPRRLLPAAALCVAVALPLGADAQANCDKPVYLTFDTGQATIPEDQVGALANVAGAMLDLLNKNPAETFLIEGHTDAVGSDQANLILSDARAATVARILTDFYHIPPENLATQGYGERFLKVQTDAPERLNRRVTIRRITPLITVATQNY